MLVRTVGFLGNGLLTSIVLLRRRHRFETRSISQRQRETVFAETSGNTKAVESRFGVRRGQSGACWRQSWINTRLDSKFFTVSARPPAVKLAADNSIQDPRPSLVLYVGDWDCSGLHISELDLPNRLERYGGKIELKRIALTFDDLKDLPSFPASDKKKDPRYSWYAKQYKPLC